MSEQDARGAEHEEAFHVYRCGEYDNEVWLPVSFDRRAWCAECSPERGSRMRPELGPGGVVRL